MVENTIDAGKSGTPNKAVKWIGRIALIGAVLGIIVAYSALTLARYDVIDKLYGFIGFMGVQPFMIGFGVLGLIALIIAFIKKSGPKGPPVIAMILGAVLFAITYTQVVVPGRSSPPLHDITTDLDNPPAFNTLSLREDNLVGVETIEGWKEAHSLGYPDIAPITLAMSGEEALSAASALVESRGWEVAVIDAANGQIEATANAGYIRFKDDVIIRVTALEDGTSRIDMRSVSRIGLSDLGFNAKRVAAFMSELQAAN